MENIYIVVGDNEFFAGTFAYKNKEKAQEIASFRTDESEDTKYYVQRLYLSQGIRSQ